MNVCFDVDGFLIDKSGKGIRTNIDILKSIAKNNKVYIWSGEGWKHAQEASDNLGLGVFISGVLDKYGTFKPDLAFDNQEIDLGIKNIKI